MTPQELKNSILQLAIQGKLVEQRVEEGTGEQLYREILAEKVKLIKTGKIKKDKPLPEVAEDERSFDIPESWKWVRFGSIMINRDAERIPLSTAERESLKKTYDYYGASGIIDKVDRFLFDKKLLLIGEDGANLLTRSTPIAFLAQGRYWVNNHAHVLDCNECFLCMDYVMYHINAISLAKYVTGTAQPKMNQEKMNSIPIALPSLAEQKRIVAKIEELLPYIDRYEQSWCKLKDFNKRFPGDMQKSILQFAIQGKLVEQRPEEGTGEALYRQIQAEKQRLIKSGTIKKEKPLPEIAEDEKPFDIPDSWKWVRFGHLYSLSNGIASRGSKGGKPFPVLRLADLPDREIDISNVRTIDLTGKEISSHLVQKDDLIFIRVNGSKGRVASAFRYTADEPMSYCDHLFCGNRISQLVFADYIMFVFNAHQTRLQLIPEIKTTAGQNTISQTSMVNILLPLPPLAEQKRIVAKLEEILPLCEKLK